MAKWLQFQVLFMGGAMRVVGLFPLSGPLLAAERELAQKPASERREGGEMAGGGWGCTRGASKAANLLAETFLQIEMCVLK